MLQRHTYPPNVDESPSPRLQLAPWARTKKALERGAGRAEAALAAADSDAALAAALRALAEHARQQARARGGAETVF